MGVRKKILQKRDSLKSDIIPRLQKAQNDGKLCFSGDIGQTSSGESLLGTRVHWTENFRTHSITLGTNNFKKMTILPEKDDEDILKVLDIDKNDLESSEESETDTDEFGEEK